MGYLLYPYILIDNRVANVYAPQFAPSPAPAKDLRF